MKNCKSFTKIRVAIEFMQNSAMLGQMAAKIAVPMALGRTEQNHGRLTMPVADISTWLLVQTSQIRIGSALDASLATLGTIWNNSKLNLVSRERLFQRALYQSPTRILIYLRICQKPMRETPLTNHFIITTSKKGKQ